MYADVTQQLSKLTCKSVKFKWTADCHKSIDELKELIVSDTVMSYYYGDLPTRVYVNESPVTSSLTQQYSIKDDSGMETQVWKPLDYTSRTETDAEKGYGKVKGVSRSDSWFLGEQDVSIQDKIHSGS